MHDDNQHYRLLSLIRGEGEGAFIKWTNGCTCSEMGEGGGGARTQGTTNGIHSKFVLLIKICEKITFKSFIFCRKTTVMWTRGTMQMGTFTRH